MKAIIEKKQSQATQLAQDLKQAKSFLFFEYLGLNAKQITLLRKKLHDAKAKMYVAKNNILNRALKAASITSISDIVGPNALIIGFEDEIAPFKEIHEIIKNNKNIKFKNGVIQTELVTSDKLSSLASIPSREGLYAMLLSCLQASIRNFAYGLKAVADTKTN